MPDRTSSRSSDGWPLSVPNAEIRPARPQDLPAAVEILEDAAAWVASLGVPSWGQGSFRDPEGGGRARLLDAIQAGGLYVASIAGEPAATVSLFDRDERFWPGAPRDALYVHKLAVRRSFAGRDLGGAILRWAADLARSEHRRCLRLDCPRDDPGVRRYYEQAGFHHRGDITVGTFEASLYEWTVAPG